MIADLDVVTTLNADGEEVRGLEAVRFEFDLILGDLKDVTLVELAQLLDNCAVGGAALLAYFAVGTALGSQAHEVTGGGKLIDQEEAWLRACRAMGWRR
jgi:hypothetical protein